MEKVKSSLLHFPTILKLVLKTVNSLIKFIAFTPKHLLSK